MRLLTQEQSWEPIFAPDCKKNDLVMDKKSEKC